MHRDRQPELMDDPLLASALHEHALGGLSRLNRVTGVGDALYRRVRRRALAQRGRPFRVIDFASGSGDLPLAWLLRARREGIALEITTVEISACAMAVQQASARRLGLKLDCLRADCLVDVMPEGFDLATCAQFMHHLDEAEVLRLLVGMQAASAGRLLVCDLHRSRLNLGLATVAARLLSRSPIVHHDAAASVRAAFTSGEFRLLAERALGVSVVMRMLHPSRFVMST